MAIHLSTTLEWQAKALRDLQSIHPKLIRLPGNVFRFMKKQRKHYTPDEKVAVLRRHLLDKGPISKLCDEQGLQPTAFYRCQKEFFENGASAFEQRARPNHSTEQERIAYIFGLDFLLQVARLAISPRRTCSPGRQREIHAERDRKLEEARKQRQVRRQQAE